MMRAIILFSAMFITNFLQAQLKATASGNFSVTCKQPQSGKVSINVTGAYAPVTYLWNDGNTSGYRDNLTKGSYTVTVIDNINQKKEVSFEIKGEIPMSYSSEYQMACSAGKVPGRDAVFTKNGKQKNAVYPISYLTVPIPMGNVISTGFPTIIQDSNFNFSLFIKKDWHTIIIDSRRCSLVHAPKDYPEHWEKEAEKFSINIEPKGINGEYYFDAGQELTFSSNLTLPDDSLDLYHWIYKNPHSVNPPTSVENQRTISLIRNDSTTLSFSVHDKRGCYRAEYLLLIPKHLPLNTFLPNAFSPNDDGINDYLTVYATPKEVVKVNWLRVFDRWGSLIFERKDFPPNEEDVGWNGKYKDIDANENEYIVHYELLLKNGNTKSFTQTVMLAR